MRLGGVLGNSESCREPGPVRERREVWEEIFWRTSSTLSALARLWAHCPETFDTRVLGYTDSLVSAEKKTQAREGSLDTAVPCSGQGFPVTVPGQLGRVVPRRRNQRFLGLPAHHPCSPV